MRMYLLGPDDEVLRDGMVGPPMLPGVRRFEKKKRQGLVMWLGWPAAMSNSRYPRGGESTKCRFKECAYENHTIAVGDPWIVFDERENMDGEMVDPFHNAGYVHLYCLEKHFDLVSLWQHCDIRLDYRTFKRESHPYFCLSHKLPGVDHVVKTWWYNAFRDWETAQYQNLEAVRAHPYSLSEKLVDYKISLEPKTQARTRMKRGGADYGKHRGDPDMKARLVTFRKWGLLDENGWPVPDADQRLIEMEESSRKRKRGSLDDPIVVPEWPPVPIEGRQIVHDPYPAASVYYGAVASVDNSHDIAQPPKRQRLDNTALVAEQSQSRKRSWEESIHTHMPNEGPEILQEEAPSKRQRLNVAAPTYPQPITTLYPIPPPTSSMLEPSIPTGHAGTQIQGRLPEESIALNQELEDELLDACFNAPAPAPIDRTAQSTDPKTGGVSENGQNVEGEAAPAINPAPACHPELSSSPLSDKFGGEDDLFGTPKEFGTPPSTPGSPMRGGALEPDKIDLRETKKRSVESCSEVGTP
ncbi:hypothetical protein F4808DRAFT_420193 [Astrocystis sublimbata]|nr:hypothetical protein F4808DRAFT_420193 [Astrocystis sublimbata]